VGYFIFWTALSIIAPFFPAFAESKNISELIVGIIFSANPVGAVLSSLFLGKIIKDVENNNSLIDYLIHSDRIIVFN